MQKQIYALFYMSGEVKRYFYVGRSKDLKRRMKEHCYHSKMGHEDKYQKIRELKERGIAWSSEIVESIQGNCYIPDAENFHVIRLTREGHELTNMRHGSKEHRLWLATQVRNPKVRTITDVRQEREAEENRKYLRSQELRDRINLAQLVRAFRKGVPDVKASTDIPAIYREMLVRCYIDSIRANNWRPEEVRQIMNLFDPNHQEERRRRIDRGRVLVENAIT